MPGCCSSVAPLRWSRYQARTVAKSSEVTYVLACGGGGFASPTPAGRTAATAPGYTNAAALAASTVERTALRITVMRTIVPFRCWRPLTAAGRTDDGREGKRDAVGYRLCRIAAGRITVKQDVRRAVYLIWRDNGRTAYTELSDETRPCERRMSLKFHLPLREAELIDRRAGLVADGDVRAVPLDAARKRDGLRQQDGFQSVTVLWQLGEGEAEPAVVEAVYIQVTGCVVAAIIIVVQAFDHVGFRETSGLAIDREVAGVAPCRFVVGDGEVTGRRIDRAAVRLILLVRDGRDRLCPAVRVFENQAERAVGDVDVAFSIDALAVRLVEIAERPDEFALGIRVYGDVGNVRNVEQILALGLGRHPTAAVLPPCLPAS